MKLKHRHVCIFASAALTLGSRLAGGSDFAFGFGLGSTSILVLADITISRFEAALADRDAYIAELEMELEAGSEPLQPTATTREETA